MTLVLAPLRGQPNEVLEVQVLGQSSQLCQSIDSTALPVTVNTDQVTNVSTVLGATASAALEQLQSDGAALAATVSEELAATGSAPGYTARLGYVNAASARLGTTFSGITLIAAVTWNTAADVPPGNTFTWDLWASTGGGCGGKAAFTGSSFTATGAPSAGAAHRRFVCSRADVLSALPLVIAVGIGGVGSAGAQRDAAAGSGTTVPAAGGVAGQPTTVGTLAQAHSGGAGYLDAAASPVNRVGSSGGGTISAGSQGTTSTAIPGGNPGAPPAGATGEGGAGCVGYIIGSGASGAEHGGASTTSSSTATATRQPGGTSAYGGSAGGWGATWNTASSASSKAGDGGGLAPGIGGASDVDTSPSSAQGVDGTAGGDGDLFHGASGGGGGGAAKVGSVDAITVVTAIGGNGADGGFPGGGAGGGGDAALGIGGVPAAGSFARGGTGGKGGDGLVLLTISP